MSNSDLFNRRFFMLMRAENSFKDELSKLTVLLHSRVVEILASKNLAEITKKDLNKAIAEAKRQIDESYKKITDFSASHLSELQSVEKEWLKDNGFTTGVPGELIATGITLNEWIDADKRSYIRDVKAAARTDSDFETVGRKQQNRTNSMATTTFWAAINMQRANFGQGFVHQSVLDTKTSDICLARAGARWTAKKSRSVIALTLFILLCIGTVAL